MANFLCFLKEIFTFIYISPKKGGKNKLVFNKICQIDKIIRIENTKQFNIPN